MQCRHITLFGIDCQLVGMTFQKRRLEVAISVLIMLRITLPNRLVRRI